MGVKHPLLIKFKNKKKENMACDIVSGIAMGCRDNTGGVAEVNIGTFNSLVTYTEDAENIITAYAGATVSYYNFEQELEQAEFNESVVITPENGTVHFEQTVSLSFYKLDADLKNTIKLLAQGKLTMIIKDQRGVYHMIGKLNGVRMTEGAGGAGKAFGDLNGYVVSFIAKEISPANEVDQVTAGFMLNS